MSKLTKLAFNVYEASTISRPPLVLLHGIFGSKQNWRTIGYQLTKVTQRRIYAADLPNHGDSTPRTKEMDLMTMSRDVIGFLNEVAEIERSRTKETGRKLGANDENQVPIELIGHSLGGTLSMISALKIAEAAQKSSDGRAESVTVANSKLDLNFALSKIIIVDMSPHRYRREQGAAQSTKSGDSTRSMTLSTMLRALNSVDLSKYVNMPIGEARRDVDRLLEPHVTYRGSRAFLRTSLRETKPINGSRSIEWQFNLDTITRCADGIFEWPKEVAFDKLIERKIKVNQPVLVLGGSLSDFVHTSDLPELRKVFPQCSMQFIDGASHWVHAEKPIAFMDTVVKFLDSGKPTNEA